MDAQGINLDASFSVKSVGNCTYLYAPAQGEKRKRLLAGAELAARETANRIAAREHVRAEHRNPLGIVLSKFTEKDEKPRSTSEFFALPTCCLLYTSPRSSGTAASWKCTTPPRC